MKFNLEITIQYNHDRGFAIKVGERVITRVKDHVEMVPVLKLCGLTSEEISLLLVETLQTLPLVLQAEKKGDGDGHEDSED